MAGVGKIQVLFLLAVGLALRLFSMMHSNITDSDEMLFGLIARGTLTSPWHRLSTLLQGPVYFYLTDVGYRLLGLGFAGARLLPAIFSAFSILAVYLIARELYDKRTALFASIFFTFSAAQIVWGSLGVMEPFGTFFILLSMLFLIRAVKAGEDGPKYRNLLFAAAFFALAVNTKFTHLFYPLPIFAAYLLYKGFPFRLSRRLLLPLALFLFLLLPIPVYNYFLYSESGIVDFHVARILEHAKSVQEYNALGITGINDPWLDINRTQGFIPAIVKASLSDLSLVFLLLAAAGAIMIARERRRETALMLAWPAVLLIFFLTYYFTPYYLTMIVPPMAILAARGAGWIEKEWGKKALPAAIALFIAWELFILAGHVGEKSATYQLQEFGSQLPMNATVVVDPLIWEGRTTFAFGERYSASALYYMDYLKERMGMNESLQEVEVYYVECSSGNCGLGKATDEEKALSVFASGIMRERAESPKEIYEAGRLEYMVYRTRIEGFPVRPLDTFMAGHVVGRPEASKIDVYEPRNYAESALDMLAHLALYANILVALLSPLFVLRLFLAKTD